MIRLSIVVLALVLGGCGSGGKTDERDAAAGRILPGSASDAMLQTDRLQSEAPLAAPKVADGGGSDTANSITAAGDKPKGGPEADAEKASAPPPSEVPAQPAPTTTPDP